MTLSGRKPFPKGAHSSRPLENGDVEVGNGPGPEPWHSLSAPKAPRSRAARPRREQC